ANLQCSRANAREEVLLPEEAGVEQAFVEGAKKQITVNAYERSDKARQKCIAHYGLNCAVCGFNFEKAYGEIGKGYIQVHHIVPLSSVKKGYKVNPINDLRPVCPNCHAMLHRRDPPYTIEELKAILKKQRARSRRP
ncbi:MAG: HNH endonuclease, partial [Thermoflexales bacterium]|nr:HNH endonuclease [Thermoflexales bacterium]